MAKKDIQYNDLVYGIDIETSTIYLMGKTQYYFNGAEYCQVLNTNNRLPKSTKFDKEVSFMFSYCISALDFSSGDYKTVSKGRTYKELDSDLFRIKRTSKDTILMYVHNFSYEFSFFINNLTFFKKSETFAMDLNKPVKTTCYNIEFRCSNVLLGKSIKTLGDELGIPKLDFEYDKVRTARTRLSAEEWKYNFRDVEIMLKGVYRLYRNNTYMNSVSDIPLTKTGVSRFNCMKNPNINSLVSVQEQNKKRNRRLLDLYQKQCFYSKAKNINQYNFWVNLFRGGFVYSNPSTVTKVLNNVMSFDFSSDYPYQMLYREYPENFYEIRMKQNKLEFFTEVINSATPDKLISRRMADRYINCKIIVRNLNAKFDFYPFGVSTIHNSFNETRDGVVLNGKVKRCFKDVELWLTHCDVLTLALFYDFELVDVVYLETTLKIKPTHQYRLNCVTELGYLKKVYKKYNKIVSQVTEKTHFTNSEINDSTIRNTLNTFKTHYEQIEYMSQLYLQCKSDLNSLYGDNAQHPIRPKIFYDFADREFKRDLGCWAKYENGNGSFIHKTSYIYGLYVPAYARCSILYFVYMFLSVGVKPLYIDTDSIKIRSSEYTKVKHFIDTYNASIKNDITDVFGFDFGTLELEGIFKKFTSLGSKCYMYLDEYNQIHATISGLPRATQLYNELYKQFNYNFELMVKNCFQFNTVLDYSVHSKKASVYKATLFSGTICHVPLYCYSGCVLKPVDLTLRAFDSKVWSNYRALIKQLYGFDIETKQTTIKKINNKIVVV